MASIFGNYEILETLGEGGMGTVYKARQAGLDRVVALKVLRPDAASPEAFARFEREARILARLRHPNIVRLLTMGRDEHQVYFTMDFIDGRPLSALIEEANTPEDRDALIRHLAVVARAVHYAHSQGIIHRDLKPSNIIVDGDGNPMVTDFGLAKEMDAGQTVTAPGAAVGTVLYMSPEQAQGDAARIGPAADVYALGAVLYEVLTGQPPFAGSTPAAVLQETIKALPVLPRRLNEEISRNLETVCLKCLAKAPRGRYATAEALAADLERYLAGEKVTVRRPVGRGGIRMIRSHPWLAVVAAAGLILAVGLALLIPGREAATIDRPPEEAPFDAMITSFYNPNQVRCIDASFQAVWYGVSGGAFRLDPETGEKTFYALKGSAAAVACDAAGNPWFAMTTSDYSQIDPVTRRRVISRVASGWAVRFDGHRWRTFGEQEGYKCGPAFDVVVDGAGRVFFHGRDGVSWYEKGTWKTHKWEHPAIPHHTAVNPNGSVWFVHKFMDPLPPGVVEPWRIVRFAGGTWTSFEFVRPHRARPQMQWITALACDAQGRTWFGTAGAGATCIDGETWTTYSKGQGLAGNHVTAIAVEQSGPVWFGFTQSYRRGSPQGGKSEGVSRFYGTSWETISENDGLPSNNVVAMAIDGSDRKWFFTGKGLTRYDGQSMTTYTDRDSAPRWVGKHLSVDRQGRIWVATLNDGVYGFDGERWRSYREDQGLPAQGVGFIAIGPDGRKWIVARGRLFCYDGTTWTTRAELPRGGGGLLSPIAVDHAGRKWVGISRGVACFDDKTWTSHPAGDALGSRAYPLSIAIGRDGAVWYGTRNGVARFDGTAWEGYAHLAGQEVRAMACDPQGRMWFATPRGVSCFDGTQCTTHSGGEGLASQDAYAVAIGPGGLVWVGTAGGVASFDGAVWRNYTSKAWLPNTKVTAITVDRAGRVWAGTSGSGVSCFDGTTWWTWSTRHFLAGNVVNALAVDVDGSIWVGTRTGLSRIVLKRKE